MNQDADPADEDASTDFGGLGTSSGASDDGGPSPDHPRFKEVYSKWKESERKAQDLERKLGEMKQTKPQQQEPQMAGNNLEDLLSGLEERVERRIESVFERQTAKQMEQAKRAEVQRRLAQQFPDLTNPQSALRRAAEQIYSSRESLHGLVDGEEIAVQLAAAQLGSTGVNLAEQRRADSEASLGGSGSDVHESGRQAQQPVMEDFDAIKGDPAKVQQWIRSNPSALVKNFGKHVQGK